CVPASRLFRMPAMQKNSIVTLSTKKCVVERYKKQRVVEVALVLKQTNQCAILRFSVKVSEPSILVSWHQICELDERRRLTQDMTTRPVQLQLFNQGQVVRPLRMLLQEWGVKELTQSRKLWDRLTSKHSPLPISLTRIGSQT